MEYLLNAENEELQFYSMEVLKRMITTPETQTYIVESVKNIASGALTCGQVCCRSGFILSHQTGTHPPGAKGRYTKHGLTRLSPENHFALFSAAPVTMCICCNFQRFHNDTTISDPYIS